MARLIRIVKSVPEDPTSEPAMMSALLSRTKPAPAADRPVKALSIDMTTGMSAPPTGMMSRSPKSSAAQSITTKRASLSGPAAR